MKNMLITGGCGFIGSNAALYFKDKGYAIFIADNLSRPGSEINKALLEQKGIISITKLDVSLDGEELKKLVADNAIDVLIHTAAQVAVTISVADPLFDFKSNALGTLNVLEAARVAPKKPHVLFTSTNKVYGEMNEVRIAENPTRYSYTDLINGISESLPLDFHSPYGCSKGSADQYVRDYSRIYGFPTTVFRQSCIYGKHQFGIVDQGWVAFLTMLAVFDKPITIYGDGKQVRDVLFVSDLVAAMEAAITHPEKSGGKIFNMGGGPSNTLSLIEFVDFLGTRLNKKINYRFGDWRPGDQKVYISDIRKAEHELAWSPKKIFVDGFEEMLGWIEENKTVLKKFV
jgi:CDP-paratose 2-epimerase